MIQINPLKSYIDGGVRAAITTPPSASLVFDLPGKAIWVKGVKLKGTDHTYTFSHDNYTTLINTPDKNNPESEDIKIGVNITTLKKVIDTTYNGGTLALLQEGLNTEERTWQAKILHNYINNVLPITKNIKINNINYAIYTAEETLPQFYAPTSLGTSGQILSCTSSGLSWVNQIQNTDYRVSQSTATNNNDYRIILKQEPNNNPETSFVRFSEYLTFNPSTKTLKINNVKVITNSDIYVGATSTTNAITGLVPVATSTQYNYFLRGDGTWAIPSNTWRPVKVEGTEKLGSNALDLSAGNGISIIYNSDTKKIVITNTKPDINHNTDRTGIKLATVSGTKKTDSTLILANSATGLNIQGGTNKFLIGDGTNYIEVPVIPSVSNKDATIGTALTTIATVAGVDIKAKIASYSLSNHTHSVKINGSTKTIAASGAVDLGNYLPLSGGTMGGTAWIVWPDSGNWSNSNSGITFPVIRGGLHWLGQSDWIKLFSEETSSDNLNLVLQFGDDNSNGLSIRNASNVQTSYISAGGVITTKTFKGNLDWSYITNKPSSYTPSAHTHAWNSLTHSSTTENQAILTNGSANGWKLYTLNISGWNNAANNAHSHSNKSVLDGITSTLVSNWNTAYNFVNTITRTDADKVINKWDEIVNFLAGITEDNKLNTLLNSKLSVYKLANNTNVGTIKNNGIYYSTTDASSGTLTNSPFNTGFALINMTSYDGGDDLRRSRLAFNAYGEIKVSNDRDYANTAETWYQVLTSHNTYISNGSGIINGTTITQVSNSDTVDGYHASNIIQAGWINLMRTGGSASTIKWTRIGRFITTSGDNANNDAMIEFFSNGDQNYTYFGHGRLMLSSYSTGSSNIMLTSVSDGSIHFYATIDANRYIWLGHNAWWTGSSKYRVLFTGSFVEWYSSSLTTQTTNPNDNYITDNGTFKYNAAMSTSSSGSSHSWVWQNNLRVAYATSAGNADTCDGLHVHGSRNNEANKIVRTDGNGFIQCGYINSSNGHEKNASSPTYVWGSNASDSYLRSYQTSKLAVYTASKWITARTFTVGNTSKSVDGSSNVSWSLSEIGAASSNHNHDNRYVRKWTGVYGNANKFLKLVISDEKGWIRLEVSDSNNSLTGGYGIYMIGWGWHGDNNGDTLFARCLYANNSRYIAALKIVRTSRNNYDFYFQFASGSSYPSYTINYSSSVSSIDCTVTAIDTIPTATWISSLSALQLNASQVDWSGITNKPSVFNPAAHTHSWTSITDKPTSFTPSAHTHDDRYIKKIGDMPANAFDLIITPTNLGGEHVIDPGGGIHVKAHTGTPFQLWLHDTNNVWYKKTGNGAWKKMDAGYADSAGSVAWANVTNKPATATRWPSWDEIANKPNTFTPSDHNHDGRYVYNYGGTQMDGASTNKNALGMTTSSGISGDWWHILQAAWNGEYRWNSQIAFPTQNRNGMYYRSGLDDNTAWGSWVKLLDVNNYSSILDSRYYTESEINTKLGAYLPLTGGTMTGNLSFSNSGTGFRGINYGTMGDNDCWRIGGAATGSNSGYMEIATADDGNEPIYVRQYTGVFSSVKRTLTLLDANGYTHFPSYINIGGNENNNSSPDRVWGSNSSDSYLRSYRTSALRVAHANTSGQSWNVPIQGQHWSRLFAGIPNIMHHSSIFSISGSIGCVVFCQTFLVESSHAGSATIICLFSGSYTQPKMRALAKSDGTVLVDLFWSGNDCSQSSSTQQMTINVIANVLQGSISPITTLTNDDTIPNGYSNTCEFQCTSKTSNFYKLHVNGTLGVIGTITTLEDVSIKNTTAVQKQFKVINNLSELWMGVNSRGETFLWTPSNASLILGTNNSHRLDILGNGNVGIGITSPTYKLHVAGDIYTTTGFKKNGSSDSYVLLGGGGHKLVSDFATLAQGVGTIISISKSLTPTTSWIDTGIKTDSATFPGGNGSYIVQISVPSSSGTDGWGDLYTGYFSLFTGTDSSTEDEILLHGASHALLKRIYLKTKATASADGTMHFYIASEKAFSAARTINFKFRKLI